MFNRKSYKVLRVEIVNSLKQYDCTTVTEITLSDIEFIKSVLLPIKAKLSAGLQDNIRQNHNQINNYQFGYADRCMQEIRECEVSIAYRYLEDFFDIKYSCKVCNYSELVVGVILTNNILLLCDVVRREFEEKYNFMQSLLDRRSFVDEVVKEIKSTTDLDGRFEFWLSYGHKIPFTEYIGLTVEEEKYWNDSIKDTFLIIANSRKKGVSIDSYLESYCNK